MDYPVLNKSPDVAQAVVPHTIDANGNAVPVGSATPSPVAYFPKPFVAGAAAMTRPANITAYSAGDAVSNNATAGSVTPISFTAADVNDAPLLLTHVELLTNDTGPATAGATFEVWLFNSDPTANSGVGGGDNAAFSQKQAGFIGRMSGTFIAASDGSMAICTPVEGTFIPTTPASGGKTLYALLKTLTGFTPSANSTTFTATLKGVQGRA
ncbi:MAG: hypothetical protein JSS04_11840 [Proteobacteria bacterium]|nr:hypothetical protein [Pseudomonadota bacterium]